MLLKKASVDATLQELRRVRDGVQEQGAQRCKLEGHLRNVKFQHQGPDVVVLQDLCRALELPIAKSDIFRPPLLSDLAIGSSKARQRSCNTTASGVWFLNPMSFKLFSSLPRRAVCSSTPSLTRRSS